MKNKFENIISKIDSDILNEETKSAISEAFESAVNEKVETRVQIEVDNAVKKLDEEHSAVLEQIVEAIDQDHTNKFKKALNKVDSDYALKLQKVVEKYDTILESEAKKFHENLVNDVSNYIELYIENAIPRKQLEEACKKTKALKMVEEMRKIVSVDDAFINENIKEALEDGKTTIDSLRSELNEVIKENIKLNVESKKVKADLILEKKTSHMSDDKKKYVKRVLGEKSPEEIDANFDYVVEMFERDENDNIELVSEQVDKDAVSKTVDTPKSKINDDINKINESNDPMDSYLKELE